MARTEHPADAVTVASQPYTRDLSLNQRQFWIIIGAILLAMFVLRVSQIGHGLPDAQMGDENSDLSVTARMLVGQLPKVIDRYTRTIVSNVELIGFGAIYIGNLLKTGDGSANTFRDLYFSRHADFIWVSQLLIVIISALALIALADLVRRVTTSLGGIIAALLMCFYYFWNLNTIYAMPDTLIASAITIYSWSIIYLLERGSRRAYAVAGAALAFVMLAKLSAAPVGLALLTAHAFRMWNEGEGERFMRRFAWSGRLLIAAVSTIIANIVLNPVAFIHPDDLIYELRYRFNYGYGGYGTQFSLPALVNHVASNSAGLFTHYVGLPLTILLVIGILAVLLRRRPGGLVLLVEGIVAWLGIAAVKYVIEIDYCVGEQPRPDSQSGLEFPPLNADLRQRLRLIQTYSPFAGDVYCPTQVYDRTTMLNRDDLDLFYRPGPVVKLYEVDRQAMAE